MIGYGIRKDFFEIAAFLKILNEELRESGKFK